MRKTGTPWDTLADKGSGSLERPYPKTVVAVPRAISADSHQDGVLRWTLDRGHDLREPCFRTLAEFAELGNASSLAVESYAKQWGVLGLCGCNLPASHNLLTADSHGFGCKPLSDGQHNWEFVSLWRRYAREARAILSAAVRIADGDCSVSNYDHHVILYGIEPAHEDPDIAADIGLTEVAMGVNRWLDLGDVRPALRRTWTGTDEELILEFGGASSPAWGHPELRLFGALAIQLMQSVSGLSLPCQCASCGRFFKSDGRRTKYCDRLQCGRRAAWRAADRKRYARKGKTAIHR